MMRRLQRATVCLLAVASWASCKQENSNYCCTQIEACDGMGLVECTDPDRPYCDNFGDYNSPGRTCVPSPGQVCEGPDDCTGELGLCIDGLCAECETSADCTAEQPVCDPVGHSCGSCDSADDCTGHVDATFCDEGSGACVGCLGDTDCSAAQPVCDVDSQACRACAADTECASGLCDMAGGACVAADDILYVDATGTGDTCTAAAPCPTIQEAIDLATGTRHWIAVAPGTYSEHLAIEDTTVRIVGEGATVAGATVNTPVVTVSGAAEAVLRGLIIRDGPNSNGHGIVCSTLANAPVLTLAQVHLTANGGQGVQSTGCTLTIDASTIRGNNGGGLNVNGGVFTVRNSMLTQNGNALSAVGGADLTGDAGSLFEHNTVANNVVQDGVAGGVQCVGSLALRNNIIYGNDAEGVTQVSGNCTHTYSLIGPESEDGTGNLSDAPSFVDAANNNFHLVPGSAGIDAAASSDIATDIDGDARPQGDGPDMGADEVVR